MSHKKSPQEKEDEKEIKKAHQAFNDLVKRARAKGALVGEIAPGIGGVQVGPTYTITVNIKPKFLQTQMDI